MKDFYYILGLEINCTFDDIKYAYRKLSKKFHPDINQGDHYFENRFKEIKEAYDTLSDPPKRARYDKELKEFRAGNIEAERRGQPHQPQYASRRRRKGPGVGMTIVLILIALIISDYLVRYFTKSKPEKPPIASVVSPVRHKTYRNHKKKHNSRNKIKSDTSDGKPHMVINIPAWTKPVSDLPKPIPTITSAELKPAVSLNKPKPAEVPVQPKPDEDNTGDNKGNYLYATYVRPNATGIINMRRHSDYGSDVIGKIPANSKVFVLEKGDAYYRVAFNSNVGYVPKWALLTK